MEPVVGQASSNRTSRGWFGPRNLTIALVALVLLIVGGIVYWQHHDAKSKQSAKVDVAIAQSQAAYNNGDYTNALNLMLGMASQATSNKQKAQVYQMEAQAAAGAGKNTDAVHYYILKHQADPSTADGDAYTLGRIYQQLGQKDNALAQYKIALAYANSHKNQYTSDAPAIQASIDALEGTQ